MVFSMDKNEFAAANYDRLYIFVKKGMRAELKKIAKAEGLSVNAYVCRLLEKETGLKL
jgi:predicted HicB family RNase H-like nuclease